MVKYCSKCGAKNKNNDSYCIKCGAKIREKENNVSFDFLHNKKIIVGIIIVILIIIIGVSAFLLAQNNNSNIKTHEFNYSNKVSFNISDELTNKTGVESLLLGAGVSYNYKNNLTNMLGGLVHSDGLSDSVEEADNTAYYKKIASNKTQQGLETHIYQYDGAYGDEYIVYINLKNYTFTESNGFTSVYDYFSGTFDTLEEAQIFIKTFKVINTNNQTNSDSSSNTDISSSYLPAVDSDGITREEALKMGWHYTSAHGGHYIGSNDYWDEENGCYHD